MNLEGFQTQTVLVPHPELLPTGDESVSSSESVHNSERTNEKPFLLFVVVKWEGGKQGTIL